MTQPPLVGTPDTVVNTQALRDLEPFLTEVVAELRSVGSFLDKVAPTSSGGSTPSVSAALGAMTATAQVNSGNILTGAAASVRSTAAHVEQVFAAIVETRTRYERTEADNTVAVTDIFRAMGTASPAPADTVSVGMSPFPGADRPILPAFDDPATYLGDPTRTGHATVETAAAGLLSLDRPRSFLGKSLARAEIAPDQISAKVTQWGAGDWTDTLTAAQAFERAAGAAGVLRTKVEAAFDYVAKIWMSVAFGAAQDTFNRVLVELDQQVEHLGAFGQFENATATALAEIDTALAGYPPEIVPAYQSFLDLDRDMGGADGPPGVGWIITAGESANLTARILIYNSAYLQFCGYSEAALSQLADLRRQYFAYAQQHGVCAASQSYPQPVPRF